MSVEEKLDEFIKQTEINRQEDANKSKLDRLENLGFISLGFAIAMFSIALASINPPFTCWKVASTTVSSLGAIGFLILMSVTFKQRMKYIPNGEIKNFWDN